eukprot:scaffold112076_cov30-Tisochrysis_lutea.AAC.4
MLAASDSVAVARVTIGAVARSTSPALAKDTTDSPQGGLLLRPALKSATDQPSSLSACTAQYSRCEERAVVSSVAKTAASNVRRQPVRLHF